MCCILSFLCQMLLQGRKWWIFNPDLQTGSKIFVIRENTGRYAGLQCYCANGSPLPLSFALATPFHMGSAQENASVAFGLLWFLGRTVLPNVDVQIMKMVKLSFAWFLSFIMWWETMRGWCGDLLWKKCLALCGVWSLVDNPFKYTHHPSWRMEWHAEAQFVGSYQQV